MAEVMKYEDFKEEGSENAVKVTSDFFLLEDVIILALLWLSHDKCKLSAVAC